MHTAILPVDKSLRALERDRGGSGRRLRHYRLFLESKPLIDELERICRLEERGLR